MSCIHNRSFKSSHCEKMCSHHWAIAGFFYLLSIVIMSLPVFIKMDIAWVYFLILLGICGVLYATKNLVDGFAWKERDQLDFN